MAGGISEYVFKALFILGVFVVICHFYRIITKYNVGINPWMNWIHIIIVAPLLLLIGYYGKNTNRRYFDLLFTVGLAATGYHSLQLMRSTMLA